MKYYFPLHFDAGNRGCQGISEGTARILGVPAEQLIGYCSNTELDKRMGIDKSITLVSIRDVSFINKIKKQIEKLNPFRFKSLDLNFKYQYKWIIDQISKDDIMISTGGDMMCYGNNMVITTNNVLHQRGVKTILWGCSMGKENETPEKVETLKNFSLIYARESLSYEYFKSLGLNNVVCLPDPAFVLQPVETELPPIFAEKRKVVGINISPFVLKNNDINSPFGREVKALLDYITKETEYSILLIPHVLWAKQDDRITAQILKGLYPEEDRISILDSDKLNYMQIRYIISKCSYFIGARTHAVISAYSTCVPTLAIGYSIKSKGIAKDVGLPIDTIVDSTKCSNVDRLVSAFKYLESNKSIIKDILQNAMPDYTQMPLSILAEMEKIIK